MVEHEKVIKKGLKINSPSMCGHDTVRTHSSLTSNKNIAFCKKREKLTTKLTSYEKTKCRICQPRN